MKRLWGRNKAILLRKIDYERLPFYHLLTKSKYPYSTFNFAGFLQHSIVNCSSKMKVTYEQSTAEQTVVCCLFVVADNIGNDDGLFDLLTKVHFFNVFALSWIYIYIYLYTSWVMAAIRITLWYQSVIIMQQNFTKQSQTHENKSTKL